MPLGWGEAAGVPASESLKVGWGSQRGRTGCGGVPGASGTRKVP